MAVVGAGGAAQVVHLPILKRLPDLEIVGVADADVEKARTIAERFEVPHVAARLSDLLDADLDAVVVCTPNDTHEEIVVEALEAGAHVLCERPIAPDAETARRMVEASREAGRQLMVAMNQRFRFDVRSIRQFVSSGELGDVFFVRAAWLNQRFRRPRKGWRTDPDRSGGGVLMDLGVQALDVALWLLDFPRVERVVARFHGDGPVEDSAVVLLGAEGGTTISMEATWELMEERDRHSVYALGTSGSAGTAPFRVVKDLETGLSDVTPPLDAAAGSVYTASYRQEWAEFLRRVRGEKEQVLEDAQIELMRVIEACYRSVREGREVALDE